MMHAQMLRSIVSSSLSVVDRGARELHAGPETEDNEAAGEDKLAPSQRIGKRRDGDEEDEDLDLELDDHEAEMREMSLLQLQSYGRAALDEIDLLHEELRLLKHREQQLRDDDANGAAAASSSSASHAAAAVLRPPIPPARMEVTRINKAPDGSLVMMSALSV